MKLLRGFGMFLCQTRLDVHVDIFEPVFEYKLASLDFAFDDGQFLYQGEGFIFGDNGCPGKHF